MDPKNPRPRLLKPRVVVADDDARILKHVGALLARDFDVVGCAANGCELIELVRTLSPAVAVADVTMPEMTGIEASKLITRMHPQTKVLMMSGYSDETIIAGTREAGALGFVIKLHLFSELIPAVHAVLAGENYWPVDISPKELRRAAG